MGLDTYVGYHTRIAKGSLDASAGAAAVAKEDQGFTTQSGGVEKRLTG
jgi:hypothetical protein